MIIKKNTKNAFKIVFFLNQLYQNVIRGCCSNQKINFIVPPAMDKSFWSAHIQRASVNGAGRRKTFRQRSNACEQARLQMEGWHQLVASGRRGSGVCCGDGRKCQSSEVNDNILWETKEVMKQKRNSKVLSRFSQALRSQAKSLDTNLAHFAPSS